MKFAGQTYAARRQRGASLIEIVSYLGVAAIVIIGAVMLLGTAFSGASTNKAIQEISAMQTAVKRLYMGQVTGYGSGDTDLRQNLIASRQVPTTVRVDTGANRLHNGWNGEIFVRGDATLFRITYQNVPQESCIELVTSRGGTGWTNVFIDPNASGTSGSGTAATTVPITVDEARTLCSGTNNTITWEST